MEPVCFGWSRSSRGSILGLKACCFGTTLEGIPKPDGFFFWVSLHASPSIFFLFLFLKTSTCFRPKRTLRSLKDATGDHSNSSAMAPKTAPKADAKPKAKADAKGKAKDGSVNASLFFWIGLTF